MIEENDKPDIAEQDGIPVGNPDSNQDKKAENKPEPKSKAEILSR